MASALCAESRLIPVYDVDGALTIIYPANISIDDAKPNPIFQLFRKKQLSNKRFISAVLAFPFPFGIVGLHRIYLGTQPYVPVTYIASLGGVFGLLPLIDFFVIVCNKDLEHYTNNSKVFMWLRD